MHSLKFCMYVFRVQWRIGNITHSLDVVSFILHSTLCMYVHRGLITFRETFLLYDNNTSSQADAMLIAYAIAHEMAHQWNGNLVTFKW